MEAVCCNSAELLGHDRNQDVLKERLKKTGVCDIACLKDDDPRRRELQRRISYVKAVEVAGVQIRTAAALRPIIEKIAGVIHDDRTPSVSTVRRWIIFYEASGKDVRSLVPATKARGNRQRRFFGQRLSKGDFKKDPKAQGRANKVADLLDNSIDEVYLKDQRF